ncbi:16S rRNA (uracil(1498)-N(3))-methyltransferase [Streptomyces sp. NPDC003395]
MTAPVFVVESFPAGRGPFVLDGPEGRHAVSVKRLQAGEEVVLTDGAGRYAVCAVTAVEGKDRLVVDLAAVVEEPAPAPRITVVQALPKGDRGELAVETMTEVGVDAIVPWQAARCITQWKGDRGHKALGKWRTTAREAGKQSRRVRFPEVADAATTKQVAALLAGADFAAVLHSDFDRVSASLATADLPAAGEIVLVVGPEGGIARDELALFEEAGATAYVLGPTVLRTSTAGTAAAALLLGRTGRWS